MKTSVKKQRTSRYAVLSIISLLIALVNYSLWIFLEHSETFMRNSLFFLYVGFLLLAAILGVMALIKIHNDSKLKGKWLALCGIVLALLSLLFLLLIYIIYVVGQSEPIPLIT